MTIWKFPLGIAALALGLALPHFVFAQCTTTPAPLVADDFTSGLGGWTIIASEPGAQVLTQPTAGISGGPGLVMAYTNGALPQAKIQRTISSTGLTNTVITIAFYDDATDPTVGSIALVDDGTDANHFGAGVRTDIDASKYVIRIAAGAGGMVASPVPRTTGWHQIAFIVTPQGTYIRIDQSMAVQIKSTLTSVKRVNVVSTWGLTATVRWDSLSVNAKDTRPWKEQACDVLKDFWNTYGNTNLTPLLSEPNASNTNSVRSLFDTAHAFHLYGTLANVSAAKAKGRTLFAQAFNSANWTAMSTWARGVILAAFTRAAYEQWNDLDPSLTQNAVLTRIESEAQWYLTTNRMPETNTMGDITLNSKAEENAWHADYLATIATRFPQILNSAQLADKGKCFAYHSITVQTDPAYCGLSTFTVMPNFFLYNHNNWSGTYTLATLMMLERARLHYLAAGLVVPEQYRHHTADLLATLNGSYDPQSLVFTGPDTTDWGGSTGSMYFGASAFAGLAMEGVSSQSLQQLFESRSLFFRGISSHVVLEPPTQITTFNQDSVPGGATDYWFVNTNIAGNVHASLLELAGGYSLSPLFSSNFELPDLSTPQATWGTWVRKESGWVFGGTSENWTYTGRGGLQRNGSTWNTTAPVGFQTAMLQGNVVSPTTPGTMERSPNLAAGVYVVSFLAAQRVGYGIQTVKVSIKPPGAPQYTDLQEITPVDTVYRRYVTNFKVTAGVTQIRLQVTNVADDRSVFVDDFALIY